MTLISFLLQEQTLLLTLTGMDLDLYSPAKWRLAAHEATSYLTGSQIHPVSTQSPSSVLSKGFKDFTRSCTSLCRVTL